MIVILGESGSGKTTLVNMLVEKDPRYHRIVTYTTRPKRYGEQDGIDYHFINENKFKELMMLGFFVESSEYRGYLYGTAREDCTSKYAVAILNPSGMRSLKRQGINVFSIYLNVDRRSRLIKLLNRGDDIDVSYRTMVSDIGEYNLISNEVDVVIYNSSYHLSKEDILNTLMGILKRYDNEFSEKSGTKTKIKETL